jgi:hypothetical protein
MPETQLSVLHGEKLDGYVLHVGNISKARFIEETNFELYLKTTDGEISENPAVKGQYFSGRGEFYKPWLEIYYYNRVKFKSKIADLSEGRLDEKLFKLLSDLLPPSSHIMVIYFGHEETMEGLQRGVPAPATPIGYLLWMSGFTWFKDWYFPEGGLEGDVKLQGEKPTDDEKRRKDLLKIREELVEFLREEKRKDKLFTDAVKRAENVLKDILQEISAD